MIYVVAVLTAQPGQRHALLAAFRENMPAVHAEDGCIAYRPVVDTPDAGPIQTPIGPDSFMVLEQWRDMAALMAHAVAPHMKAYGKAAKDLIASRAIHVLSEA